MTFWWSSKRTEAGPDPQPRAGFFVPAPIRRQTRRCAWRRSTGNMTAPKPSLHQRSFLSHREAILQTSLTALDASGRHRHHRRRKVSCARTRHAVSLRSQAMMQLFAGNTPPEGLGQRVQRAARSSHRMGNIACAGALSSPAMPMRVIARKSCRAMVGNLP